MKTILTIAFFIVVQQSNAQIKYDYNWVLGYDNDLGMEGGDGILLNFDSGEVLISSFQKDMFMHTDNISMSNLNGVLLFYSNGCFIANKNHEIMLNGDNINPGTLHDSYCDHGYPMQQGMLGIPTHQQENKYYLFHTRYGNTPFYADKLYYTIIDMDLDGGLGGVIEKNIPIIEDTIWAGYLTAVKHSNNLDWWIISAKGFTNEFYKILLKSDGVHINDLQQIGLPLDYAAAGGQSVFSPDGTKYAWYDQVRNVQLFDFNRNTGALSNPQQLILADTNYLGGVAISPDSRFLYVSSAIYLYQFDLNSADIQSSKIVIDTFDGYSSPFPANFFLMQLGPDCRIYMSTGNGTDRLHVINNPNRKGKDCDFQQHAIQLPKWNASTIPNNPNYRLGTPYPVCDSTIQMVVSSVEVLPPVREVTVYPNPAANEVTIQFSSDMEKITRDVALFAISGREVLRQKIPEEASSYSLNTSSIPAGAYFITIFEGGKKVHTQQVFILK